MNLLKKPALALSALTFVLAIWILLAFFLLSLASAGLFAKLAFAVPVLITGLGITLVTRRLLQLRGAVEVSPESIAQLSHAITGLSLGLLGFSMLAVILPGIIFPSPAQSGTGNLISLAVVLTGSALVLAGYQGVFKSLRRR